MKTYTVVFTNGYTEIQGVNMLDALSKSVADIDSVISITLKK